MSSHRTRIGIYPGSFDPITHGHEDIVYRALEFVDHLIVAVAHRRTQKKEGLFAIPERVEMIREVFQGEPRIEAAEFDGLLVDYAKERGATLIVRGLRAVSDFEYEFQMAQMNQELWGEIETVFLTPEVRYSFLSASLVREVASLGGDVSPFVSAPVLARMREKLSA